MRTLVLVALMGIATLSAQAAGVAGKWKAQVPGMEPGGPSIENTFVFKVEGKKLTGSANLGEGGDLEIQDGKVDGNAISFTVTASFGAGEGHAYTFDLHFSGKLSGDTIAFSRAMEGDDFGAKPMTFTAKRAK